MLLCWLLQAGLQTRDLAARPQVAILIRGEPKRSWRGSIKGNNEGDEERLRKEGAQMGKKKSVKVEGIINLEDVGSEWLIKNKATMGVDA